MYMYISIKIVVQAFIKLTRQIYLKAYAFNLSYSKKFVLRIFYTFRRKLVRKRLAKFFCFHQPPSFDLALTYSTTCVSMYAVVDAFYFTEAET